MSEREGFLASITLNIREIMYETGTIRQGDLENEILKRLGLFEDLSKHATVKRRIYDALSTFIALEIIRKEEKTLYWVGFPQCDDTGPTPSAMNTSVNDSAKSVFSDVGDDAENPNDDASDTSGCLETTTADDIVAQLGELEEQIRGLRRQSLYYDFFNARPIGVEGRSGEDGGQTQYVPLPLYAVACPTQQDIQISTNASRTKICVQSATNSVTVLRDDGIVHAFLASLEDTHI
ncbi:E2F/DP family winged-helix DNA-binding domain-containing protein [Giardia muris]|uniref:E2F/DP family winged-helix DNA-binding domain-containing protein n=1 Tax=Giardia muris TaxID=5742 RepID=A0A4Z1SZD3_GIAMU|nr:E2F/DP family winged-helix DNA-binding domain-containing protein [Giardia muris]|eukprot:TNJ30115.1 E2F/DP family winged-helix DNA-binding domain-containing protein [Giardia muris]